MSAQRASQLVEAGLWLRLSGDQEGAKRLFEQALKLDPTNARARQLLDSPPAPAAQPNAPGGKATMELDWGMATGQTPTPPPVAPAEPPIIKPSSSNKPFGQGAPPGTHTVRLGEASAPEIPEAPRFEDPHGEVMITGADDSRDNSTLVFGLSGVPVPPVPQSGSPLPQSGTMVFGGAASRPQVTTEPGTGQLGGGTLVFSGGKDAPPAVPPVARPGSGSGSGTLVFSGTKEPTVTMPTNVPATNPGGGTLVFGSAKEPQGTGTMVFSGTKEAAPQPPPSSGLKANTMVFGSGGTGLPQTPSSGGPGGTMVFGGGGGASSAPPANPPGPGGTMVFGGGGGSAPPAIAPVAPSSGTMVFASPRDEPLVTEPGAPVFAAPPPEPKPQLEKPHVEKPHVDPGRSITGTLEFNFDDMVGPPGPLPSPPVPMDGPHDDGPQTAWDKSNPRIDISKIEEGEGGGFDLISAAPAPQPKPRSPAQLREEVATLLSGAKDLLDLDDHSGAMELISKAIELDPSDAGALKLRDRSEKTLQTMFESKLGDMDQTPRVKLKEDEIIWLNLDHRAGFVLAQIDGSVTFEDLFAVSGMSRLDTARILAQLVEEGVISKG